MSAGLTRRTMLAGAAAPLFLLGQGRRAWADGLFAGEPPDAVLASRTALVVGVGSYEPLRSLGPNPLNDAKAVHGCLQALGFGSTLVPDPDRATLVRNLEMVAATAQAQPGLLVIYFAGHGLSIGGRSYIVPRDAVLDDPSDVEDWLIPVDRLYRVAEAAQSRATVVILDACRNDPLRGANVPGVTTGVRASEHPGLFVAPSTLDGSVAGNGATTHSPFTGALLQWIMKPDLDVSELFRKVRSILSVTGPQTNPCMDSLTGDVRLMVTESDFDREQTQFQAAMAMNKASAWAVFLQTWPVGYFYVKAWALWKKRQQEEPIEDAAKLQRRAAAGSSSAGGASPAFTVRGFDWLANPGATAGLANPLHLNQIYGSAGLSRPAWAGIAAGSIPPFELSTSSDATVASALPAPTTGSGSGSSPSLPQSHAPDQPWPGFAPPEPDHRAPMSWLPTFAAVSFNPHPAAAPSLDPGQLRAAVASIAKTKPASVTIQAAVRADAPLGEIPSGFSASLDVASSLEAAGVERDRISFAPTIRSGDKAQVTLTSSPE